MCTSFKRVIILIVSFLTFSNSFSCLRDLAADKFLDLLLSQTFLQQAITLKTLPKDIIDILRKDLIAKYEMLLIRTLSLKPKELKGHKYGITSVVLSSDGNYALAGSFGENIRLWNLKTLESQKLKGYECGVNSLAFSLDGNYVLTGSDNRTARLLNLKTLKIKELKGHTHDVKSVALSPDGNFALTGSEDRTARLWDLKTLESKEVCRHRSWVTSVAFSSDGNYILTGSLDSTACLLNLKTLEYKSLKGHKDGISSVAFSPGGNFALTGSQDKTARLWDLKTLKSKVLKGHRAGISSVAFSSNGNYALTGSDDGTVLLWYLKTLDFDKIHDLEYPVNSVVFSPDSTYALTASENTLRLLKIPSLEEFTLEQLIFIIRLTQSTIDLDCLKEQQMLESFATAIDPFSKLLSENYATNLLVKAYIDMKRNQLFKAAAYDDVETVAQLLKKGLCLNTCDKAGNNLWHYAFKGTNGKASEKVLNLLLSLENMQLQLKKANKAGQYPFVVGLIHNKDFTQQFITNYCN
ncbi:WD40 repeat domain-containing protein [Candidatus Dependentiae bacterium]|nr:WD40 repeat domain-containing protein [Candidatus Dependentiae bacterium]